MDSFKLYKCKSKKPYLKLNLEISGSKKNWLIPKSTPIKKNEKRLAVELSGEERKKEPKRPALVDKSRINIKYLSKRKIIFKLIRTKLEVDEFVLLVPSWGLRTEKKIWILIPV